MKMIAGTKLPKDCVTFMKRYIRIGNGISNYFRKKGIKRVSLVFNYQEGSILLIDTGDKGYPIYYRSPNLPDAIKGTNIDRIVCDVNRFVDVYGSSNVFQARLITDKSILLQKIPLRDPIVIQRYMVLFNIKEKLMIYGDVLSLKDISQEDFKKRLPEVSTRTVKPSKKPEQPEKKPVSTPIVSKETPNIPIVNEPAAESPVSDLQKQADKEYSKMILGE